MMKYKIIWLVLILGVVLSGCVVYTRPYPPPPVVHTHGTGTYIIHSDIEWVVWEYYDWDYDIVVNLHSLNYSSDEISLILFLAYHGHCEPLTVVHWRQAGISWVDITTGHLKLSPTIFFVNISPTVKLGPPYGQAYGHYWKTPHNIVLTESEMINLVHLKVTSEAFNIPPVEVIKLREQGKHFDEIVQVHLKEGKGIRSTKGRVVKERPPQMRKIDTPKREPSPDKDRPDKTRPDKDKPDKNQPDKTKPDKSKPDKDKPDKDKPDKDKPDKDKPGKDKPDKGKGK